MSTVARPHNQTLGAKGEALAEHYLVSHGFQLLEKNWRCRYGELDLIMRDGDQVVAVEVKTRAGSRFGNPLEAITAQKASRLQRLLFEWVRTSSYRGCGLRIDAVGIILRGGSAPSIDHLRGIS